MANQVFDTTIVRPLERPSAADLNQMQGQIYRTMRHLDRLKYGYDLTSVFTGFINYSFFVQNLTGLMQLNISRGVGYADTFTSDTNIDGIPGLNDINSYKPIFLSSDKQFTVPSVPNSGKCRRDLLEVRWYRDTVDPLDLEIYDPGTKNFSTTSLDKTMTTDLAGKGVEFYENGVTPSPTAYFIYKKGPEVDYVDEGSYLNSTLPSVDAGCLALASINVRHGDFVIPNSRIADRRKLLGNDRQFVISGTATVGKEESGPNGSYLSDVSFNLPTGMSCTITKLSDYLNDALSTQYQLNIFGPRIATLYPAFQVFHGFRTSISDPNEIWPTFVTVTLQNLVLNTSLSLSDKTLIADSAFTTPANAYAIGSNCSRFNFALVNAATRDPSIGPYTGITLSGASQYSRGSPPAVPVERTRKITFVISGTYEP